MPTDSVLVIAGILAAFLVFSVTLFTVSRR
jgi:hypothetical protein